MLGHRLSRLRPSVQRSLAQPLTERQFIHANLSRPSFGNRIRLLSTRASTEDAHNDIGPSKSKITATPDAVELMNFHKTYFQASVAQNAYDLRPGTYQDVDETDILRYFPEGLAGETADEFAYTSSKKWMIRDATKVMYRIIEESEKRLKYDATDVAAKSLEKTLGGDVPVSPDVPISQIGMYSAVSVPRLSEREDWPNTQMNVTYYGKELFPTTTAPQPASVDLIQTKGPGSVLENFVDNLKKEVSAAKQDLPDRVILTGERGTGKSTLLNQSVMFARQRGWLTLFVNDGWEHVHSGPYVEPLEVKVGGVKRKVYDNPYMNKVLLRGFWKAHHKQLKRMVIEDTEALLKYNEPIAKMQKLLVRAMSLPGRDKLNFVELRALVTDEANYFEAYDAPDSEVLKNYDFLSIKLVTLEDLVLLGIALADQSGKVFYDLVNALRNQTQYPVLFAVDGYNTWFASSTFAYGTTESLLGREILVPSALTFITSKKADEQKWTVKRGLCIAATSIKHNAGREVRFDQELKQSIPLRVKVPVYSNTEYLSAMSRYLQPRSTPMTPILRWEDFFNFRMVTSSTPRLVRVDNMQFFLPKVVQYMEKDLELAALMSMSSTSKSHRQTVAADLALGYDEEEEDISFESFTSTYGKVDGKNFAPDEEDSDAAVDYESDGFDIEDVEDVEAVVEDEEDSDD